MAGLLAGRRRAVLPSGGCHNADTEWAGQQSKQDPFHLPQTPLWSPMNKGTYPISPVTSVVTLTLRHIVIHHLDLASGLVPVLPVSAALSGIGGVVLLRWLAWEAQWEDAVCPGSSSGVCTVLDV